MTGLMFTRTYRTSGLNRDTIHHNSGMNADPQKVRFQVEHKVRRPGLAKRNLTTIDKQTMTHSSKDLRLMLNQDTIRS